MERFKQLGNEAHLHMMPERAKVIKFQIDGIVKAHEKEIEILRESRAFDEDKSLLSRISFSMLNLSTALFHLLRG